MGGPAMGGADMDQFNQTRMDGLDFTKTGKYDFNQRELERTQKEDFLAKSNNARFKKFEPRSTIKGANDGLNYGGDFAVNPKKFYCKEHKEYEIEFCCAITNKFYCRKCKQDR